MSIEENIAAITNSLSKIEASVARIEEIMRGPRTSIPETSTRSTLQQETPTATVIDNPPPSDAIPMVDIQMMNDLMVKVSVARGDNGEAVRKILHDQGKTSLAEYANDVAGLNQLYTLVKSLDVAG